MSATRNWTQAILGSNFRKLNAQKPVAYVCGVTVVMPHANKHFLHRLSLCLYPLSPSHFLGGGVAPYKAGGDGPPCSYVPSCDGGHLHLDARQGSDHSGPGGQPCPHSGVFPNTRPSVCNVAHWRLNGTCTACSLVFKASALWEELWDCGGQGCVRHIAGGKPVRPGV